MSEKRPKTLMEEMEAAHDAFVALGHEIAITTPFKQILRFCEVVAQWIADRMEPK